MQIVHVKNAAVLFHALKVSSLKGNSFCPEYSIVGLIMGFVMHLFPSSLSPS